MKVLQKHAFREDRTVPFVVRRLLLDALTYDYFTYNLKVGHYV